MPAISSTPGRAIGWTSAPVILGPIAEAMFVPCLRDRPCRPQSERDTTDVGLVHDLGTIGLQDDRIADLARRRARCFDVADARAGEMRDVVRRAAVR